jgi:hypothetical protein
MNFRESKQGALGPATDGNHFINTLNLIGYIIIHDKKYRLGKLLAYSIFKA